jgi:hypothetical protein
MNERIKELAQQAGFKVNWHNADVQAIKMARLEKFAELIVRECADIATINSHQWHSAGRFVLTHFGVEE